MIGSRVHAFNMRDIIITEVAISITVPLAISIIVPFRFQDIVHLQAYLSITRLTMGIREEIIQLLLIQLVL